LAWTALLVAFIGNIPEVVKNIQNQTNKKDVPLLTNIGYM